jgi:hypothetical protein
MRVICFPEPRAGPPLRFPAPAEVALDGGELATLLGLPRPERHGLEAVPSPDPERAEEHACAPSPSFDRVK